MQKLRKYKYILVWLVLISLPILNISYAKMSNAKDSSFQINGRNIAKIEGLKIKSIDTQVISKHWNNVDQANIQEQVKLIRDLGANYIAISTPYDKPEVMKSWAYEIHKAGLNVWFRSHWLNWEGDEDHLSDMTVKDYLDKTSSFIEANPTLFKSGDSFTVCVEPEQVFTARGTDVYDWYSYNKFVVDQINVANLAFSNIGLSGEIFTNWISMNGWVVENALEKETVEKLGLITVDHYQNQKNILPSGVLAEILSKDLDRIHEKWDKPIILGEWGYNIEREVSDFEQKEVIAETLKKLSDKKYLIGLNYWVHMGNSSSLISDSGGSNLVLRPSASIIKDFYNSR